MIINGEFVKGSYYLDKSFKYYRKTKAIHHHIYRIDVTYGKTRYRARYATAEECEKALLDLKKEHPEYYRNDG